MKNKINKLLNNEIFNKNLTQIKTPACIYNFDVLEEILNYIRSEIENEYNIKLYYAMKANNTDEVLSFISNHVDGVDVASFEEYKKAKKYFNNISLNGPYFDENITSNIDNNKNLIIDMNSLSQLKKMFSCGMLEREIGIRVNIDYNENNELIKSRFGISLENKEFYNYINDNDIKLVRIHFHNGNKTNEFFDILKDKLRIIESRGLLKDIRTINLGGGISEYIEQKKFHQFIDEIRKISKEFKELENINYIIEPGNAIVEFSGLLVSQVTSSDICENKNFVTLDTSAYNINRWIQPKIIGYKAFNNCEEKNILTNIYGNTCFEQDIYIENKVLPYLNIGDRVFIFPVGGYCKSNSTNLHDIKFPKEYFFYKGELIGE